MLSLPWLIGNYLFGWSFLCIIRGAMEMSGDTRTVLSSICAILKDQIVHSEEMRDHLLALMKLMRRELPANLESPPRSAAEMLQQIDEIIQRLKA